MKMKIEEGEYCCSSFIISHRSLSIQTLDGLYSSPACTTPYGTPVGTSDFTKTSTPIAFQDDAIIL